MSDSNENYNYLKMRVSAPDGQTIRNAQISWLALKDGVGPTEEFDICLQDDIYSIKLPGTGVYFFRYIFRKSRAH